MFRFLLLFSDPKLGQVQPTEENEPSLMIIIVSVLCTYVVIVVVSYIVEKVIQIERRRRG